MKLIIINFFFSFLSPVSREFKIALLDNIREAQTLMSPLTDYLLMKPSCMKQGKTG